MAYRENEPRFVVRLSLVQVRNYLQERVTTIFNGEFQNNALRKEKSGQNQSIFDVLAEELVRFLEGSHKELEMGERQPRIQTPLTPYTGKEDGGK